VSTGVTVTKSVLESYKQPMVRYNWTRELRFRNSGRYEVLYKTPDGKVTLRSLPCVKKYLQSLTTNQYEVTNWYREIYKKWTNLAFRDYLSTILCSQSARLAAWMKLLLIPNHFLLRVCAIIYFWIQNTTVLIIRVRALGRWGEGVKSLRQGAGGHIMTYAVEKRRGGRR